MLIFTKIEEHCICGASMKVFTLIDWDSDIEDAHEQFLLTHKDCKNKIEKERIKE